MSTLGGENCQGATPGNGHHDPTHQWPQCLLAQLFLAPSKLPTRRGIVHSLYRTQGRKGTLQHKLHAASPGGCCEDAAGGSATTKPKRCEPRNVKKGGTVASRGQSCFPFQ